MKKLAQSVAGGSAHTIARRCMAIPHVKKAIVSVIVTGKHIRLELKGLCANWFPSVYTCIIMLPSQHFLLLLPLRSCPSMHLNLAIWHTLNARYV